MSYYELPLDIQAEIKKLASEHPVSLDEAYRYYMMGGYEHGKKLCELKTRNVPNRYIELYNTYYWDEKNKEIFSEINKCIWNSMPWYSKVWISIKEIFRRTYEKLFKL
jgi:hypothetical protein